MPRAHYCIAHGHPATHRRRAWPDLGFDIAECVVCGSTLGDPRPSPPLVRLRMPGPAAYAHAARVLARRDLRVLAAILIAREGYADATA